MKNLKKVVAAILMVVMITGIFTACGGSGDTDSALDRTSLKFSIDADIVSLDTHMAKDTVTGIIHYQIYDTLVKNDPKEGIVPSLAESWEISEDGKNITFLIRQGVKFQNGETMTTEDVAFSLNRAIGSSFTSSYTETMDHAEAIDDTHVVLYMKQAFGPVFQCLSAACMGIVPKAYVEEVGDEGFADAPVGTGPYKFVEWSSGEKITLEAFDEYWQGEPTIKDLSFMIMTDKNTAAIALESEEVDVLYAPSPADHSMLESLENVQFLKEDGSVYMWVVAFNNESEYFKNEKVRQAISYAVDRQEMVDGYLNGFGISTEMPIVPSVFGYDPSFKGNGYDLDKAKELLAEAGYPDGFTCTIKLNQSSTYTEPAQILQAQLRKIGINLEFELEERAAFLQDVTTDANYDITLFMFTAGYTDADYVLYGRLHSNNIGGTNYLKYSNPQVDKLLDQARSSTDEQERKELYYEISEYVRDEAPFIPLFSDNSCIAASSKLTGVRPSVNENHYVYEYAWTE